MKRKKVTLGFLGLLICLICCSHCAKGVPTPVEELIFQKSRFAEPIFFKLDCADSPDEIKRLRKQSVFGHPPLAFIQGNSMKREQPEILNFLTSNNFANVEEMIITGPYRGSIRVNFLSYTDKIKPFIIRGSTYGTYGASFDIIIAKRILKSIDYINNYTGRPLGFEIKFCAITFTYALEEILPGLPKIEKKFQGKAVTYLDPEDGKWKIEQLQLSDEGGTEYKKLL